MQVEKPLYPEEKVKNCHRHMYIRIEGRFADCPKNPAGLLSLSLMSLWNWTCLGCHEVKRPDTPCVLAQGAGHTSLLLVPACIANRLRNLKSTICCGVNWYCFKKLLMNPSSSSRIRDAKRERERIPSSRNRGKESSTHAHDSSSMSPLPPPPPSLFPPCEWFLRSTSREEEGEGGRGGRARSHKASSQDSKVTHCTFRGQGEGER